MARVINIHGEYRGSIGGNTYSANRGGAYVRQRVTPVQPATEKQIAAKARFGVASQQWANLSAEEKQSYRDFAGNASRFNPIKRLNTGNQSGSNAYTSLIGVANQCSQAVADALVFADDNASSIPYTGYLSFAVPNVAPVEGMNGTMLSTTGDTIQLSVANCTLNQNANFSFRLVFDSGNTAIAPAISSSWQSGNGKILGIAIYMSSFVGSFGNRASTEYQNMIAFIPPPLFDDPLNPTKYVTIGGNCTAQLEGTKYGLVANKITKLSFFAVGRDGTAVKFATSEIAVA
jgi:hypothetical protein